MQAVTHERPREKLQRTSVKALSARDLIQLIIGTGTKTVGRARIAKKVEVLLRRQQGTVDVAQLQTIPGIGYAKAAQLVAALELHHRFQRTVLARGPVARNRLISGLLEGYCRYSLLDFRGDQYFEQTLPIAEAQHCLRSIVTRLITENAASIGVGFRDKSVNEPTVAVLQIARGVQLVSEVLGVKLQCMLYLTSDGVEEL